MAKLDPSVTSNQLRWLNKPSRGTSWLLMLAEPHKETPHAAQPGSWFRRVFSKTLRTYVNGVFFLD